MQINITITQDDIFKNPDIITGICEFAMHLKDVSGIHKEEKKNSFELGEVENKTEKVQTQEARQDTVEDLIKKKPGTVNTDFEKAFEDNTASEVKPDAPEEKTETSLSSDDTAAEPIHTIEDLREIAVKVSKKKGKETVKRIINSFGFGKISDTTKDKLNEVYKLFEGEL